MSAIMADHDIEGQLQILLRTIQSPAWIEIWNELRFGIESFTTLALPYNLADAKLWQL